MKDKGNARTQMADDEFLAGARRAFKRVARRLRIENDRPWLAVDYGRERPRAPDSSERDQAMRTPRQALELVSILDSDPGSASQADEIPVAQHILDELDRRLEEYRRDPSTASSWPEVKQRIRASRE